MKRCKTCNRFLDPGEQCDCTKDLRPGDVLKMEIERTIGQAMTDAEWHEVLCIIAADFRAHRINPIHEGADAYMRYVAQTAANLIIRLRGAAI